MTTGRRPRSSLGAAAAAAAAWMASQQQLLLLLWRRRRQLPCERLKRAPRKLLQLHLRRLRGRARLEEGAFLRGRALIGQERAWDTREMLA